jgi:hypothetical protein
MSTETNQFGDTGIDPAFWSIAAALGAAIVYVACVII